MGNENHQLSFPIQNNINKIQIRNKKIKSKDINIKQIKSKIRNPKILKRYVIPRISTTPERDISISGIFKDKNNNKRYGSYEKNSKNKFTFKNDNKKKINRRNIFNNRPILYITNLLNSLYSNEINKELSHINIGTKNLNFNNTIKNKKLLKKGEINFMFDAAFKYNYFYNNYNKINRKRNNSKNRGNNPHLYDSKFQSNEFNEIKNSKKQSIDHNIINIILNDNINKNNISQNTTLILNQSDIDCEIISVNNKIRNNNYKYISNELWRKKYSESNFKSDSESEFISSEEISILNNIKINKKTKEEDASESQTDKQEIINKNLTNKNKNNNNYFIDSILNIKDNNNKIFKNNELNIKININDFRDNNNHFNNNEVKNDNSQNYTNKKNNNKNNAYLNNKKNIEFYNNNKNSKQKKNEDKITLMNKESNKYDDNITYVEILLAMNEKKSDDNNIFNIIKNKTKKIQKNNVTKQKTYDIGKKLFISSFPIKKEITQKNRGNKTPKINNTNKIILKNKKITPLKKIPINENIFADETDNYLSQKKSGMKSINKFINVEKNLSPRIFIRNSINETNNISSIVNIENSYLNIKNKKSSQTPSPSNSKIPSSLDRFNNKYKDRYTYKKKSQINNSLRKTKKISDKTTNSNNTSYKNIIYNSNGTKGYYTVNNNSNLFNKVNNTNNCVNFNTSRKGMRNSGNKNKIIYFKKERLSGNSLNKPKNFDEIIEVESRNKSNDQKYCIYNSKNVLISTKKKK